MQTTAHALIDDDWGQKWAVNEAHYLINGTVPKGIRPTFYIMQNNSLVQMGELTTDPNAVVVPAGAKQWVFEDLGELLGVYAIPQLQRTR